MDFRLSIRDAFQSFNSYLGVLLRRPNAALVGPSRQLVGEFAPEVPFDRLYEYYHGWPAIKASVDVQWQKLLGAGWEFKCKSPAFQDFVQRWMRICNFNHKLGNAVLGMLVTGTFLVERQFDDRGRLANVEQIPLTTVFKAFRDAYGNYLKLQQVVDGLFKDLDPQYYILHTINNPERTAFGRSIFYSLAAYRKISNPADRHSGLPNNPARVLSPLLESHAEVSQAQIEIVKKLSKPRVFGAMKGMPQEQLQLLENEMADERSDKWLWLFDREVTVAEAQLQSQGKFPEYTKDLTEQIDLGTQFGSKVITEPGGFSYASGVESMDVVDEHIAGYQDDLTEILLDGIIRVLYDTWFREMYPDLPAFDDLEPEGHWKPRVRKMTLEDIAMLNPAAVSPEEYRQLYKAQNISLDDTLYEKFLAEQSAMMMGAAAMGAPPPGGAGGGGPPAPGGPGSGPPGPDEFGASPAPPSPGGSRPTPGGEAFVPASALDEPTPLSGKTGMGRTHSGDVAQDLMAFQAAGSYPPGTETPAVTDPRVVARLDIPPRSRAAGVLPAQSQPGYPVDRSVYRSPLSPEEAGPYGRRARIASAGGSTLRSRSPTRPIGFFDVQAGGRPTLDIPGAAPVRSRSAVAQRPLPPDAFAASSPWPARDPAQRPRYGTARPAAVPPQTGTAPPTLGDSPLYGRPTPRRTRA